MRLSNVLFSVVLAAGCARPYEDCLKSRDPDGNEEFYPLHECRGDGSDSAPGDSWVEGDAVNDTMMPLDTAVDDPRCSFGAELEKQGQDDVTVNTLPVLRFKSASIRTSATVPKAEAWLGSLNGCGDGWTLKSMRVWVAYQSLDAKELHGRLYVRGDEDLNVGFTVPEHLSSCGVQRCTLNLWDSAENYFELPVPGEGNDLRMVFEYEFSGPAWDAGGFFTLEYSAIWEHPDAPGTLLLADKFAVSYINKQ